MDLDVGTRTTKFIPLMIAAAVLVGVCALRLWQKARHRPDLLQRTEWMTQDWRARLAAERPSLVHSNLAAVYLDEGALKLFNHPALGYSYPLPRLVYGRVIRELKAQGARVVAFDILFLDRASDRIP